MSAEPYTDWRWRWSVKRTWQSIDGDWWLELPNAPRRRRRLRLWRPLDALRVLIHWSWGRRWF